MAKKEQTYEEKLLSDLQKLPNNTWFKIIGRPDYDKILSALKYFISYGNDFILNEDFSQLKRLSTLYHEMEILPEGVTVNHVTRGTIVEVIGHKGTAFNLQAPEHWVVSFNGKIIAIE